MRSRYQVQLRQMPRHNWRRPRRRSKRPTPRRPRRFRRPNSRWMRPSCVSTRSRSGASGTLLRARRPPRTISTRPRPRRKKSAAQVEADQASLEQARADYEIDIASTKAEVARGQARRRRCQDQSGLLPDVRPDRRADRRAQGQGRQPGRRHRRRPSWSRSSSSTRWGSTSIRPLATCR